MAVRGVTADQQTLAPPSPPQRPQRNDATTPSGYTHHAATAGVARRSRQAAQEARAHTAEAHHLVLRPCVVIKRHVLDEPHVEAAAPRQLHKVADLVLVDAPHDHHVHLDGVPRRQRLLDTVQHRPAALAPRQLLEPVLVEGVEGDVEGGEAGGGERLQLAAQRNPIGRHRQRLEARQRPELPRDGLEVLSQRRLAASEADLVDALRDEDPRLHQAATSLCHESAITVRCGWRRGVG